MSQISTEHAEKIAQLVAEVTVRRLSTEQIEPLRKDVSSLREQFTKLNTVIFNGGSGGLVNRFDTMEEGGKKRHEQLDRMMSKPMSAVRKWGYTLGGIATGGGLVAALIELHKIL